MRKEHVQGICLPGGSPTLPSLVCVGRLVDFPRGDQQRRNRAWKPPELFSSYKLALSAASVSGGHVFIAEEEGRGEGMV